MVDQWQKFEREISDVWGVVEANPPEVVYHYTSAVGLFGILTSRSIWASHILYLNDSSELLNTTQLISDYKWNTEELSDILRDRVWLTRILRTAADFIETSSFLVASFSEESDLLSQWRGYCPAGVGYSVGFRTAGLAAIARNHQGRFARCLYDKVEQQELLVSAFRVVCELGVEARSVKNSDDWPGGASHWASRFTREFLPWFSPLMKNGAFAEEREWRAILSADPRYSLEQLFRPSEGIIVPYVGIALDSEGGALPIEEIVVGPMSNQKLAAEAVRGLVANRKIGVRRSSIPFRHL